MKKQAKRKINFTIFFCIFVVLNCWRVCLVMVASMVLGWSVATAPYLMNVNVFQSRSESLFIRTSSKLDQKNIPFYLVFSATCRCLCCICLFSFFPFSWNNGTELFLKKWAPFFLKVPFWCVVDPLKQTSLLFLVLNRSRFIKINISI
jgi:hypothetical protein